MGENNEEKLDGFIKEMVREVGLETPSKDFTETVLGRIEEMSSVITYQPLISKTTWGILAGLLVCLTAFVLSGKIDSQIRWFEKINLGQLPTYDFMGALGNFTPSNTLVYSSLAFTIFFFVQIFILKTRWDKRYLLN